MTDHNGDQNRQASGGDVERTAALLFARRKDQLGRDMRRRHSEIAEEMSARGLGQSGAFYGSVNRAFVDLFNEFGSGLLNDYMSLASDLRWADEPAKRLQERYNSEIEASGRGLLSAFLGDGDRSKTETAGIAVADLKRNAEIAFTRSQIRRSKEAAAERSKMSFNARVLKVLIASPGDVSAERVAAQSIIQNWNVTHSDERKTVLLPVMWETHSSPAIGDRAQGIINRQIVKDADLLVAIFWTRIGTPTGAAKSGTVEEIEEHLKAGKPAMLYFSSAPVRPDSLDETQYAEVKAFKASMKERGLYEEYESLEQFREKFARHLALTIQREFPIEDERTEPTVREDARGGAAMKFRVRGDEREVIGDALPQESRTLLAEARKDRNGSVLMTETFGGMSVETNGRQFVERGNPRSEALWRRIVGDLVRQGLLEQRDSQGEVFSITDEGYRMAELLVPS